MESDPERVKLFPNALIVKKCLERNRLGEINFGWVTLINEIVSKAVDIFRGSTLLQDAEIYQTLVVRRVQPEDAGRLLANGVLPFDFCGSGCAFF